MLSSLTSSIKSATIKFLQFMRLVGDDGHWDWTTASLVTTLLVLGFKVESPGVGEIAALALTLLARGHKKYLSAKVEHTASDTVAKLEASIATLGAEVAKSSNQLRTIRNDLAVRGLTSDPGFMAYEGTR